MAADAVQTIIRRAVADEAFRAQLLSNPAEALAGYDLSEGEIKALSTLDQSVFSDSPEELEERISRGGWGYGQGTIKMN